VLASVLTNSRSAGLLSQMSTPTLQVLHLDRVLIVVSDIEAPLEQAPNLKHVSFQEVLSCDRWGTPGSNYQQIVDKLRTECPGLKYLKLTIKSPYKGVYVPVQYLAELTILCIDMAFL
jgi:hypothetical protein